MTKIEYLLFSANGGMGGWLSPNLMHLKKMKQLPIHSFKGIY